MQSICSGWILDGSADGEWVEWSRVVRARDLLFCIIVSAAEEEKNHPKKGGGINQVRRMLHLPERQGRKESGAVAAVVIGVCYDINTRRGREDEVRGWIYK